jgi:two-component system cell cycle response regulator CpdR
MATILVVENNRTVLETISRQLAVLEYRVLKALNVKEATEVFLKERPIDLVLIDIVLSEKESGAELADALTERDPALKILLMTGYSSDFLNGIPSRKRTYPVIRKPFRRKEAKRVIDQLLAENSP